MEFITSFPAVNPVALSYWPYYDGFRYVDVDQLCLLELASEPSLEYPDTPDLPQRITKTAMPAVGVIPRLGGGALLITPTQARLTKLENFNDAEAWQNWLNFADFQAVAAACDIDGAAYVADNQGRIHLLEPTGIRTKVVLENLGDVKALAWSAMGDTVLVVAKDTLWLFDFDTLSGFANRRAISAIDHTATEIIDVWPSIHGFYCLTATAIIELTTAGELLDTHVVVGDAARATSLTADGDFTYITTVNEAGLASLWALDLADETVPIRFFAG